MKSVVTGIDQERIAAAVREIIAAIGEDGAREGLQTSTPPWADPGSAQPFSLDLDVIGRAMGVGVADEVADLSEAGHGVLHSRKP